MENAKRVNMTNALIEKRSQRHHVGTIQEYFDCKLMTCVQDLQQERLRGREHGRGDKVQTCTCAVMCVDSVLDHALISGREEWKEFPARFCGGRRAFKKEEKGEESN